MRDDPTISRLPHLLRLLRIGCVSVFVLIVLGCFFIMGAIFIFPPSLENEVPSEEKIISSDFLINQYLENINQIRTAFRFNDVDAKFVCSASHRVFPDRQDIEIPFNIKAAINSQFVNFLLFYDENDKFLVALKAGYRVWPTNDVHKLGNCTDLLIAKRLPTTSLVD